MKFESLPNGAVERQEKPGTVRNRDSRQIAVQYRFPRQAGLAVEVEHPMSAKLPHDDHTLRLPSTDFNWQPVRQDRRPVG